MERFDVCFMKYLCKSKYRCCLLIDIACVLGILKRDRGQILLEIKQLVLYHLLTVIKIITHLQEFGCFLSAFKFHVWFPLFPLQKYFGNIGLLIYIYIDI